MYAELRRQLGGGELVELPQGGSLRLEARAASVVFLPGEVHVLIPFSCQPCCGSLSEPFVRIACLQVVVCPVRALIFRLLRKLKHPAIWSCCKR